jgi:hypothetical protein
MRIERNGPTPMLSPRGCVGWAPPTRNGRTPMLPPQKPRRAAMGGVRRVGTAHAVRPYTHALAAGLRRVGTAHADGVHRPTGGGLHPPARQAQSPLRVGRAHPTVRRGPVRVGHAHPTVRRGPVRVGRAHPTVQRRPVRVGRAHPTVQRTPVRVGHAHPTVRRTPVRVGRAHPTVSSRLHAFTPLRIHPAVPQAQPPFRVGHAHPTSRSVGGLKSHKLRGFCLPGSSRRNIPVIASGARLA